MFLTMIEKKLNYMLIDHKIIKNIVLLLLILGKISLTINSAKVVLIAMLDITSILASLVLKIYLLHLKL